MKPFGEITSSTVSKISVQFWHALGSDKTGQARFGMPFKVRESWGYVYALATGIEVGSRLPGRQAFAYGLEPEELAAQQPQLEHLTATWAHAKVFGYSDSTNPGTVIFGLPPWPCVMHSPAYALGPDEFACLASRPRFMLSALGCVGSDAPVDQVAIALVTALSQHTQLTPDFFERLYDDYARLPEIGSYKARLLLMNLEGVI